MKRDRFYNAYHIWWNGASNPHAIARSLVEALDECRDSGSSASCDIAVATIVDHLAFILDMPQPSVSDNDLSKSIIDFCMDYRAKQSPQPDK
jgi:hypothetical protein